MSEPARGWGRAFDPDHLADLELEMWKAYYRRQGGRLFRLLVRANKEQARVGVARALAAAMFLSIAAVRFGRSRGAYERFEPAVARGYRMLGLPDSIDVREVARLELRWWVVRREIGLAAGSAAGAAITALYAALYEVPPTTVAEAGSLRGEAAEVRDRGAAADVDGPGGEGVSYWPEVGRLLRASYRSLHEALNPTAAHDTSDEPSGP